MKLKNLTSLYNRNYPNALVELLESVSYNEKKYLRKLWATKDFSVTAKDKLKMSKKNKIMLRIIQLGIILTLISGTTLIYLGARNKVVGGIAFGAALILSYPIIWSHLLIIFAYLSRPTLKEVK